MALRFEIGDFQRQARQLNARLDQVSFAVSLALNASVKRTRDHLINHTWPNSVKVRSHSFMRAALRTRYSKKHNLRVEIYDSLGKANLAKHADGGSKTPHRRSLAIPMKDWVKYTSHGIKPAMLPKALIQNTPKRALRITSRGIYVGQHGRLHLRYALRPAARIKADVPFYQDFNDQMRQNMTQEFPKAIARAMQTAR